MEVGEPNRLQAEDVALAVRGLKTLLAGLDMIGSRPMWDRAQPVYYESEWVRADRGGILFSTVELGQKVGAGEVLGTVTDPLSNVYVEIASPIDGRVLGKALNQFVMPGFAAFRIGVETPEPEVVLDSRQPPAEEPSDDSALEQPDISPSDEQERLP
jgi:predicted deacylase